MLPDDLETYLLLLLADSNLPTGGFVTSAALESTIQHGHMTQTAARYGQAGASHGLRDPQLGLLDFIAKNLRAYSRLSVPFLNDAYDAVRTYLSSGSAELEATLDRVAAIDRLHDATMLSHVARRASKAQGTALLTLYARSFSPSSNSRADELIAGLRRIARASAPEGQSRFDCHLPVCWSVLTACLGMRKDRARHLHLFLHARSLISAAVRLNIIGPYQGQRTLLCDVRDLVDEAARNSADLSANAPSEQQRPATISPLLEILGSRHDCLQSRIFNS